MDDTDRQLLALLQADATRSYAALGASVGLSSAAVFERVRKLKERGIISRTTIDVDPLALGLQLLAFVTVSANAWMGDEQVKTALQAMPWVEEAHIVAGMGTLLVKVRTHSPQELQQVLQAIYRVPGVRDVNTCVVLESLFERSPVVQRI